MRIQKIELTNFKRFTSLTISDIPDSSKLVLLIGSNGSGKSCLFDVFDWLGKQIIRQNNIFELTEINIPASDFGEGYYKKNKKLTTGALIEFTNGLQIVKNDGTVVKGEDLVKKFIGRSSIRIVPRIANASDLRQVSSNADGPDAYIENDTRFHNDVIIYIQQIDNAIREPIFSGKQADTLKIFKDFIEPLNTSLTKIFGGDENTTIQITEFQNATPQTTAKLIFRKGESKINYDLLSHGEKQVVILLINFIVRQEYYKDAIIFIDEMDNHLNTALQYTLLSEIVTRWIPDSSQLWTASHALGFIDYARKSPAASIIDFNLLNFDHKQEMVPELKDKLDVYEIAIPKATITSILKGYTLVIAENKNDQHYNAALGDQGFLFLPANNNNEVFLTTKGDKGKLDLRDQDYLKPNETEKMKQLFPNLKVLSLYNFENYIYHPDNIAELYLPGFSKDEYLDDVINQKNEKLLEIVSEIGTSRALYIEFKNGLNNDGNISSTIDALKSDNFNDFYPYLNMKKHFNKYLTQFKYSHADLAKTNWFKTEILKVLKTN